MIAISVAATNGVAAQTEDQPERNITGELLPDLLSRIAELCEDADDSARQFDTTAGVLRWLNPIPLDLRQPIVDVLRNGALRLPDDRLWERREALARHAPISALALAHRHAEVRSRQALIANLIGPLAAQDARRAARLLPQMPDSPDRSRAVLQYLIHAGLPWSQVVDVLRRPENRTVFGLPSETRRGLWLAHATSDPNAVCQTIARRLVTEDACRALDELAADLHGQPTATDKARRVAARTLTEVLAESPRAAHWASTIIGAEYYPLDQAERIALARRHLLTSDDIALSSCLIRWAPQLLQEQAERIATAKRIGIEQVFSELCWKGRITDWNATADWLSQQSQTVRRACIGRLTSRLNAVDPAVFQTRERLSSLLQILGALVQELEDPRSRFRGMAALRLAARSVGAPLPEEAADAYVEAVRQQVAADELDDAAIDLHIDALELTRQRSHMHVRFEAEAFLATARAAVRSGLSQREKANWLEDVRRAVRQQPSTTAQLAEIWAAHDYDRAIQVMWPTITPNTDGEEESPDPQEVAPPRHAVEAILRLERHATDGDARRGLSEFVNSAPRRHRDAIMQAIALHWLKVDSADKSLRAALQISNPRRQAFTLARVAVLIHQQDRQEDTP